MNHKKRQGNIFIYLKSLIVFNSTKFIHMAI